MKSEVLTIKEAIAIVLDELHHRLPKSNKDGFMAKPEVYVAMDILSQYSISNKSDEKQ